VEPAPKLGLEVEEEEVGVAEGEGATAAVGAAKTRPLLVMALDAGPGLVAPALGEAETIAELELGERVRAAILLARVGEVVSSIRCASTRRRFRRCDRPLNVTRAF